MYTKKGIEHNMSVNDKTRIYASKTLMDILQKKYPETKDMSYTGLSAWAFRKLLEIKP